ncbi:MAG: hypothetical protein L7W94_07990 [Alphaproteobacteria bacterium]|nr:hypothetical protein [Alphaproteobacteria bacterium]
MTNFPNKHLSSCNLRLAGVVAGLTLLLSVPAAAQRFSTETSDQGPVDLLATIQDNRSTDSDEITYDASDNGLSGSAGSISSIDDAVNSVTELPVLEVPATSEPTQPATLAQTATDASTTADGDGSGTAASGTPAAPASPGLTLDTTPEGTGDTGTGATGTGDTGDTSTASSDSSLTSSGASLQKSSAPVFGIANIGIETAAGLNVTIWRDTSADRAALLLDNDRVLGSSPALSALAHNIVAHRAVPPVGAADNADALVAARLDWMAASGRSQMLESLVGQLPDEEPWLDWKQWLVETQLMARRDEEACRTVMYQVSRTFEPFWHKAKVICSAAMGDAAGAQFAADILSAMGVDDALFSALVANLLNDTDPGPIDPSLLEPLHIVLLDAAHSDINVAALDALSDGSVQTAVGLRYLDADARLVSTWRALDRGIVDHGKAAKLWRSATFTGDQVQLAASRHQSQPSALTRALVWRALDKEQSIARLPMIASAMDADTAGGAGLMMAPLYAELVRQSLGFEGAGDAIAADPALAVRMALLLGIGDTADLPPQLDTDTARAARDLLAMIGGGEANVAPLDRFGLWHLLPLIELGTPMDAVMNAGDDWLELASPNSGEPASFLSVSPVMLRAMEQAAGDGRVAETVLLAHRIVGTLDLAAIHPADAARVARALDKVGQPATAKAFAGDVAKAHLLVVMRNSGEVMPIAMIDAAANVAIDVGADDTAAGASGIETETIEAAGEAAGEGAPAIEEDAAVADAATTETGAAEAGTADGTGTEAAAAGVATETNAEQGN